MAWITENEFRARWVSQTDTGITLTQITGCLNSAKRFINKRVDSDSYDAAKDATDETLDVVADLREAQQLLAARAFLLIRGGRLKDGGIHKRENDPNSQSTVEFLAAAEIEKERAALLNEALEAMEIYLLPVESAEILPDLVSTGSWF